MDRLIGIDEGALYFFQSLRKPWLDKVTIDVTRAGNNWVLGAAAGAMFIFCLLRGRWRTATAVALSSCLGLLLLETGRHFVDRPRPEVRSPAIALPSSSSFPSGHALASMAIYGIIGLGLAPLFGSRTLRTAVMCLGFLLPFVIGVTRLYLGVHYLFDVVAGWTGGLACVLLGLWIDRILAPAKPISPLLR